MSNEKSGRKMNGMGYYIALILCAVAIGVAGYLYYRNTANADPRMSDTADSDVQAVATQSEEKKETTTQEEKPTEKSPLKTTAPLSGSTVTEYAMDCLSYNQTTRDWRVHDGIDIAAETGTEVHAAADGTVYTVFEDDALGNTVVLRHQDGYMTQYSSLEKDVPVKPGDSVTMGQTIGTVGQTALMENAIGGHLHFSVSCDGKTVDPNEFLKK